MRKYIKAQQLDELSEEGKKRLKEWWKPAYGDKLIAPLVTGEVRLYVGSDYTPDEIMRDKRTLPVLSIGQMIEFLDDSMVYRVANTSTKKWAVDNGYQQGWLVGLVFKGKEPDTKEIHRHEAAELCDALWMACKEVLEG